MVQPPARIRLSHARGGDAGHLRPYGDVAPLRADRAAPRPDRAGALRPGPQGTDGCRGAAGRHGRTGRVTLINTYPQAAPTPSAPPQASCARGARPSIAHA